MDERKQKFLVTITRMCLVMLVSLYVSGFVQVQIDLLWAVIGICFLVFVLFILHVKLEK